MSTQPFRILAVYGKRFSGKTTIAEYLVQHYGFQEFSFASYLKQACCVMFGFSSEQVTDPILKETVDPYWGVTPRAVLQTVGTDLFRDRLPQLLPQLHSIWVRRLVQDVQQHHRNHPDQPVVISDLRFPDEYKTMRDLGAYLVKVSRPAPAFDIHVASGHTSETALDNIFIYTPDRLLMNDSTKQNLYAQVDRVVEQMFLRLPY